MQPLAETAHALAVLRTQGDWWAGTALRRMGREVEALVPSCTGLSVTRVGDGVTLTLVARREPSLPMAAFVPDPAGSASALDERRWSAQARLDHFPEIRSSLYLPVTDEAEVIAGIDLYAAEPEAFTGLTVALAAITHGSAVDAVHDADLTFRTRQRALEAPSMLSVASRVDRAVGVVAKLLDVDRLTALVRLSETARRTDSTLAEVARTVIVFHG
jgi:hypothetical protein